LDNPANKGLTGILIACLENWIIAEVLSMARSSTDNAFSNVVTLCLRADFRSRADRQCFAGLTHEETEEFEALESFPPLDDNGDVAWNFEAEPITWREKRWLELYKKHDRALKPSRS
jgi:hypothetical protein